jgi:hypothetical protein
MNVSKTVSLLGHTFHFKFQHLKTPKAPTAGISARIPHTVEFTVFLDYDNIKDERLVDELMPLQEVFHLGDFHVFATNEFRRHAVCIDRLPLREALEIVYSSSCDYLFKRGIKINEYRTWILRALPKGNRPKPKYLYSVKSDYDGDRLQSQAHGLFFWFYGGAEIRMPNPDNNTELEVQGYLTSSKLDARKLAKIWEAQH